VLRCVLLAEGRALLLLLPSEQEAMLKALEVAKVPVKVIKMNPHKQQPITGALQALLSKDSALKVSHCPCLMTQQASSLPFGVTKQVSSLPCDVTQQASSSPALLLLSLPIKITFSSVQRTCILSPFAAVQPLIVVRLGSKP
jgi:hypothetical protein